MSDQVRAVYFQNTQLQNIMLRLLGIQRNDLLGLQVLSETFSVSTFQYHGTLFHACCPVQPRRNRSYREFFDESYTLWREMQITIHLMVPKLSATDIENWKVYKNYDDGTVTIFGICSVEECENYFDVTFGEEERRSLRNIFHAPSRRQLRVPRMMEQQGLGQPPELIRAMNNYHDHVHQGRDEDDAFEEDILPTLQRALMRRAVAQEAEDFQASVLEARESVTDALRNTAAAAANSDLISEEDRIRILQGIHSHSRPVVIRLDSYGPVPGWQRHYEEEDERDADFFYQMQQSMQHHQPPRQPQQEPPPLPDNWLQVLKEAEVAKESDPLCLTCCTNRASILFVSCGHQLYCDDCVRRIWLDPTQKKMCPVCPNTIQKHISRPIYYGERK